MYQTLTVGTRLGSYEILSALGAGGMGEVYRARDTKLNRDVAIKVLLPDAATAPDRLSRFRHEAQVLASLNHPQIAQIYGVEDTGGVRALVMELIEGPTLQDRIARGAIPLDEALPIAKQIAEALEAAHEQGIIHRDLKPANIKLRPDGTVKVLDFGLAKAIEPPGGRAVSQLATVTSPAMTQAGIILGTAAYMSPEQASGKPVDKRTDLWAFGVVLLEMLLGHRAFDGESLSHVLAAVLTKAPDWTALPSNTPAQIRTLLRRCLEKDRRRRLESAADARLEIEDAMAAPEMPAASQRRIGAAPIALALSGGALVAALTTWVVMRPVPPTAAPLTRLTITPPPGLVLTMTLQAAARDFAVAPDGSFLVYRSGPQGQLVVRRFDRLDAAPLANVTGAAMPFVSPDSRWIGFVQDDLTLKKVPVGGGSPVTLARLPVWPRGASWIDDATIIIGTNSPTTGLLRVAAGGGEPTVLTIPDRAHGEEGHVLPSGLPGGRAVLFTVGAAQPENAQIALLDLETGERKMLLSGGRDGQYVTSGHLVYAAGGALSAVPFNLAQRTLVGSPVRVVDGVGVAPTGSLNAAVTRDGMLVYLPAGMGDVPVRSLVWIDRQGRETPIPAPGRAYTSARLSADGTRVAVAIRDQENDIWVLDLVRQTLTRLTFDPDVDFAPVWTPDGRRIVFASTRTGVYNLYARAVDGTGADVRLTTSANTQLPNSITADGTFVVGHEVRPRAGADLVRFALDNAGGAEATVPEGLVETAFDEWNGEVSPDGRFLAYQSAESGREEIYVRPYPQVTNGRWQVSTGGGTQPMWTRGGTELIYLDGANHLTAVSIETTRAAFHTAPPTALITTTYATKAPWRTYDVLPDGQRFLMIKDGAGGTATGATSFVVVQNWLEELRRLVPTH